MSYRGTKVGQLIPLIRRSTTSYNSIVSKILAALTFTNSTCRLDISKLMHNNIIFPLCLLTQRN